MPDVTDPADPYAGAQTVHEQSLADSLLEGPQPGGGPTPTREFPAYGPPGQPAPRQYPGPSHQQTPYQPSQQPSSYPPPPYQPPVTTLPPAKGNPDRRRGWLIAGGVFLLVAALATTLVLVLQQTGDSGTAAVVTGTSSAPQTAGPPESARPSVTAESKALPTRSAGASATATTAGTATAPTPAPVTTAPSDLPLGGPRVDIPCADGYIVQVASELDPASFEQRVAALRAAGTLPAGTSWTEANTSCAIFTAQVNVLVLYAGPFAAPYDACAARLAAPPDAFIKGTTPATANTFVSCLCPATADQLPAITAVGQQGVWVGELQRVLGSALDLNVGSINADASIGYAGSWGIYTEDTAGAVGQFQATNALPVTNQVDTATWAALQSAAC